MEKKKAKKTGRSGKVKKLTVDDLKKIVGGSADAECEFAPTYPYVWWKGPCCGSTPCNQQL